MCPKVALEDHLLHASATHIRNVIDLDFALRPHFTITLRDVSYLHYLLLRVLQEERDIHQDEQIKRNTDPHGRK